jgi:hypothetical protein
VTRGIGMLEPGCRSTQVAFAVNRCGGDPNRYLCVACEGPSLSIRAREWQGSAGMQGFVQRWATTRCPEVNLRAVEQRPVNQADSVASDQVRPLVARRDRSPS